MFTSAEGRFESTFEFVLFNRLPAGETNVRHVHENIEKVYYFLRGNAEIDCGPWRTSASAGEFLFFPADIAHQIRSLGPEDLEFIVCAASTTDAARGMSDGGLLAESGMTRDRRRRHRSSAGRAAAHVWDRGLRGLRRAGR